MKKEKENHAVKPEEQERDTVLVAASVAACKDPNSDGSRVLA